MNYKLIATDMDDTLLNESQEISAGNEKAIVFLPDDLSFSCCLHTT